MKGAELRANSWPPRWSTVFDAGRLSNALRAAGPPLLFGLRLWASVCLALYVAFWLELDNAFWAGTTAAIVCQPHLGASLCMVPAGPRPVPRRAGAVVRCMRSRRHASAQFRVLFGGARRLHGGDLLVGALLLVPFLAAVASGSACPIGCLHSSMRGARSSRSASLSSS